MTALHIEIGAIMGATERSNRSLPQGGGASRSAATNPIQFGGRIEHGRRAQNDPAPNRRRRCFGIASAAPSPHTEIGATHAVTGRSAVELPQGGGASRSAAPYPSQFGGHAGDDCEVHGLLAPNRRRRLSGAASAATFLRQPQQNPRGVSP